MKGRAFTLKLQANNGPQYPQDHWRQSSAGNSSGSKGFPWQRAIGRSSLRRRARRAATVDLATIATPLGFLRGRDIHLPGGRRVKDRLLARRFDEGREFVAVPPSEACLEALLFDSETGLTVIVTRKIDMRPVFKCPG